MKFFQKRSVAWTICICMILGAILIGQVKQNQKEYEPPKETQAEQWAWKHYAAYEKHIRDDADLLSRQNEKQLSIYNASSDYTYDSVCGIWIVDHESKQNLSDLAKSGMDELGLGANDFILILDPEHEDWAFSYGTDAAQAYNHDLELLVAEAGASISHSNSRFLVKLFSDLAHWYQENLKPVNDTDHVSEAIKVIGKAAGSMILFALVLAVLVIGGIITLCIVLTRKYNAKRSSTSAGANSAPRYASGQNPNKRTTHYTSDRQKNDPQKPNTP